MTKIMLVEDDKNLSAIYQDRLLADGYDIVSAHDGEEALAMAVKEKPDLIIADVMMPKISGFDMLDILRSTPETKNTKVIIMTALSQVEDQQRAAQLGADKYLVKSQVTLDDVARVVREVLGGTGVQQTAESATPAQEVSQPAEANMSTDNQPVSPVNTMDTTSDANAPVAVNQLEMSSNPIDNFQTPPAVDTVAPVEIAPAELPAEPVAQEKQEVESQIQQMADALPVEPQPAMPQTINPETPSTQEATPVPGTPQPSLSEKPDIMELYEKEMAKEAQATPEAPATPESSDTPPSDPHSSISL